MEEIKVITRDFNPADDEACIYSTWRNGAFFSSAVKETESPAKFFRKMSYKIKEILESAQVRIACLEDSPETIVGYSVSRGTHLDWIYVKPDYRMQRIATILIPKTIETYTSDLTKIGSKIVEKKNLTLKENESGRTENRQEIQRI